MRTLTGTWNASLVRGPCEDWSSVVLTLVEIGSSLTGEIGSPAGVRHPVTGTVMTDHSVFSVGNLSAIGECSFMGFDATVFEYDARGRLIAFAGDVQGRCCGTIAGSFRFVRQPGG